MSDSIYAPPEAEVVPPPNNQPRYYVVSPKKFLLLTIATLGGYFLYWFYCNWRQIKAADNDSSWPIARAIFSIFFTHSLLADVDGTLITKGKTYDWQPTLIATIFVVVVVGSRIASRLLEIGVSPLWSILALMATPILYAIILQPAQKAINVASDDAAGAGNSSITAANWIWVVIGALVWLLQGIGVYALYFSPELIAP